jgi:hypothetical protein
MMLHIMTGMTSTSRYKATFIVGLAKVMAVARVNNISIAPQNPKKRFFYSRNSIGNHIFPRIIPDSKPI